MAANMAGTAGNPRTLSGALKRTVDTGGIVTGLAEADSMSERLADLETALVAQSAMVAARRHVVPLLQQPFAL